MCTYRERENLIGCVINKNLIEVKKKRGGGTHGVGRR